MTKIKILCFTLILLLVVECHLRQTQLSSVSPAGGEKDGAYDILNANLDKLIKIMTLSNGNTVKEPVAIASLIVSIVGITIGTGISLIPNAPPTDILLKLSELNNRVNQLVAAIKNLELQFLLANLREELRTKVKVPLGVLESRINRYKGGAEGLPELNASCHAYETDKLFISYIELLPELLALEMKEVNYAEDAWDANSKIIVGISKQLAYVFGLCQVAMYGIPNAGLNETIEHYADRWGFQIEQIVDTEDLKMLDEYWTNEVITRIMDKIFYDNILNTDEKITKANNFFQLNWRQFGYSFYLYAVEAPMKDPGAAASFDGNYWEKWYPDYNLMVGIYRNNDEVPQPITTCTFEDIFGFDICFFMNTATYERVRWEISERMKSKCNFANKKIMFADSSEKANWWSAGDVVKCFAITKDCFFYQPRIFVCVM